MPVIRIQRSELEKLGVSAEVLEKNVRMLGADLKSVDEEIQVEFFPDRPDLYTVEGVARALKFYTLKETPGRYAASAGNVKLSVESSVSEVRPYIVAAVIRNVNVDEAMIKSMMDFQEKLHITVGRKRKKVAIGLHDFDKVEPPFTYTTRPGEFSFVPLGFEEEMSLDEILTQHPKGVEYAHILAGHDKYPVILDSRGEVLSFPPIINGVLTQITPETKNIFVDMTGTDLHTLLRTLNIVACAFADRGATIETVEIEYPDKTLHTPELKYEHLTVSREYAERLIGTKLSDDEIALALQKMGYRAEINDEIDVEIPPFRMDILHPVDIVEDIIKGYGFDNVKRRSIERYHRGSSLRWEEKPRLIMVGLGFLEVKTLTLVSFNDEYDKMRMAREENVVIENPVSELTETLRTWLIPSLMEILRNNRHRELPQKIFEVGYVRKDALERHLGFVMVDSRVGFTDSKSIVERILKDLGVQNYEIREKEHSSFISGRCASVFVSGTETGFFGELHPRVLENYELGYPVIAGELNLEKIN
ncbi:MAG: phenylalanine--tRNA ligase subunit beta [Euryarchaeota archaeon]|nr:phenylalanine--tRNA ligase subunit beta [Euryarchaeota archaeon]